ncbi:hypothetical protein [Scrofimicrobium sp. R131]|uniref:Uncharacterized protein n=1 Tax=Scrofimicrobium appendicitidis TaxID=3079930 RepID=A0AAU7V5T8_9ACTO
MLGNLGASTPEPTRLSPGLTFTNRGFRLRITDLFPSPITSVPNRTRGHWPLGPKGLRLETPGELLHATNHSGTIDLT